MSKRPGLKATFAALSVSTAFCATMFAVAAPARQTAEAPREAPVELQPISEAAPSSAVDYDGFSALTGEVAEYRKARMVSLDDFLRMANEGDTIILDTRSSEAFRAGHISGAVNLNFSDFTEDKLAGVIGDKARRVLIYCNNNFSDNAPPVILKSAPLALNIPTFINLYGYGYRNIYELGDQVTMEDLREKWVSGEPASLDHTGAGDTP